jgi:hypothetical protein
MKLRLFFQKVHVLSYFLLIGVPLDFFFERDCKTGMKRSVGQRGEKSRDEMRREEKIEC